MQVVRPSQGTAHLAMNGQAAGPEFERTWQTESDGQKRKAVLQEMCESGCRLSSPARFLSVLNQMSFVGADLPYLLAMRRQQKSLAIVSTCLRGSWRFSFTAALLHWCVCLSSSSSRPPALARSRFTAALLQEEYCNTETLRDRVRRIAKPQNGSQQRSQASVQHANAHAHDGAYLTPLSLRTLAGCVVSNQMRL